jgi:hypothetical protein
MNITIKEKGATVMKATLDAGQFQYQNHLWLRPELQLKRICQRRRWQMKNFNQRGVLPSRNFPV